MSPVARDARIGRTTLVAAVAVVLALLAIWLGRAGVLGPTAPRSTESTGVADGAPAITGSTSVLPDDPEFDAAAEASRTEVPGGAMLRGIVKDRTTGNPVPGIEVRVTPTPPRFDVLDGVRLGLLERVKDLKARYDRDVFEPVADGRLAVTDATGRFELRGVPRGRLYLYASSARYYQDEFPPIELADVADMADVGGKVGAATGAPREEVVWVTLGGCVVGRVTDRRGTPLAGVEMNLFYPLSPLSIFTLESRGSQKVRTRTDENGDYELRAVAPGRGFFLYTISDHHPHAVEKGIEVAAGRNTRVDVILASGGVLRGRVAASGGAPIAGAEVRPIPLAGLFDMLWEGDVGLFDGVTDAGGNFRVDALPDGRYRVFVRAAGYRPGMKSDVIVREGEVTPRVDFELATGSFLAGRVVDVGGRPIAGASIRAGGGRPMVPGAPASRFSRSGRGVEFENVPFPVATYDEMSPEDQKLVRTELFKSLGLLRLEREPDASDELVERPFDGRDFTYIVHRFVATSDDDGAFRVDGLPEDEAFWVWIHHEEFADRVLRGATPGTDDLEIVLDPLTGFTGAVIAGESGEPVTRFELFARNLLGFDEVRREIVTADGQFEARGLNPGPYRYTVTADGFRGAYEGRVYVPSGEMARGEIVVLEPGAVIEGVVVERATGRPIEGARVLPFREEGTYFENFLPRWFVAKKTDVEGRFRVAGLAAGDVTVTVSHPRYVETKFELERLAPGEARLDVVIPLVAGGTIDGRVIDARGAPVCGVDVMVESRDRSVFRQAVSDREGRFLVDGLGEGTYAVMRLDLDLSDGDVYSMLPRFLNGLRPVLVEVEEGRAAPVTLRIGEADEGTRVEGRVLEAGMPIAGAFVTLFRADGGSIGSGGLHSARTDELGRFHVDGVVPGAYLARISGPPLQPGDVRVGLDVPDLARFAVDLLVPGGEIDGRVVTLDSRPLASLDVSLEAARTTGAAGLLAFGRTTTDAGGRFRFRRLAPGTFAVHVRGRKDAGVTHSDVRLDGIELRADERHDLGAIVLGAGGSVRGVVVDAEGRPVERAAIFFRAEDGRLDASVTDTLSGPDGSFTRDGLSPGRYRVQAKALGYGVGGDSAAVIEGRTSSVRIVLPSGASLRVAVIDADGRPVAGARIEVRDAAGEMVSDLVGPSDLVSGFRMGDPAPGVVLVTGLAPGRHAVTATHPEHGPATASVHVAGEMTPLVVVVGG